MEVHERAGWLGQWEVVIRDLHGNVVERTGLRPNLLTDAGLGMVRDLLKGDITDGKVKYVALGSGNTAPAGGQTALVSEQFRKAIASHSDGASPGQAASDGLISDAEANSFRCEEIGWFAGEGATAAPNSGIMVARVLYSRQKNALESWTIRRIDTIGRA